MTLAGKSARVAVVGGGLAGLAAAVRLVDEGASVDLFESRRRLGGRAGSFLGLNVDQGLTAEQGRVAGAKRSDAPEPSFTGAPLCFAPATPFKWPLLIL